MKKLGILIAALLVLLPLRMVLAAQAQILLLPTRIVMEKDDRFATVIVRNTGDATGNLSIDLIDMEMTEDGRVVDLEEGKKDPHSAIPYLRIAPQSMTLKPGDAANVRVLLRKPQDLPAGEYRSHLKVKIEDDNVEASTAAAAAPEKETAISVKAKLAFTIPFIIRTGETNVSIKMEAPKLARDEQGKPVVKLVLLREGNRSVMGDFTVSYTGAGGTRLIKTFAGVPIYRNISRREVTVPLDETPAGVDLTKGKLDIVYTAQEKEGGMKLAETSLPLSP